MPSKISVNYDDNGVFKYSGDALKDFYCIQDPKIVLNTLIPKYHVVKYKSISINLCDRVMIDNTHKNIRLRPIYIEGISITDYVPPAGLEISGSIDSYNPGFVSTPDLAARNINDILKRMIGKNLVDIKVLDNGFYLPGALPTAMVMFPSRIVRMGKQEPVNYMKLRSKNPDPKKEEALECILDYGQAVLGKSFDLRSVEKIANSYSKNVPREFDPQFGSLRDWM